MPWTEKPTTKRRRTPYDVLIDDTIIFGIDVCKSLLRHYQSRTNKGEYLSMQENLEMLAANLITIRKCMIEQPLTLTGSKAIAFDLLWCQTSLIELEKLSNAVMREDNPWSMVGVVTQVRKMMSQYESVYAWIDRLARGIWKVDLDVMYKTYDIDRLARDERKTNIIEELMENL